MTPLRLLPLVAFWASLYLPLLILPLLARWPLVDFGLTLNWRTFATAVALVLVGAVVTVSVQFNRGIGSNPANKPRPFSIIAACRATFGLLS